MDEDGNFLDNINRETRAVINVFDNDLKKSLEAIKSTYFPPGISNKEYTNSYHTFLEMSVFPPTHRVMHARS